MCVYVYICVCACVCVCIYKMLKRLTPCAWRYSTVLVIVNRTALASLSEKNFCLRILSSNSPPFISSVTTYTYFPSSYTCKIKHQNVKNYLKLYMYSEQSLAYSRENKNSFYSQGKFYLSQPIESIKSANHFIHIRILKYKLIRLNVRKINCNFLLWNISHGNQSNYGQRISRSTELLLSGFVSLDLSIYQWQQGLV